jgi:hypothetical protein
MVAIKDPPRGGSLPTRRILRKEANFGCAICGEPYLTYHHFDPTWAERHHDEPKGMIALCAKHAGMADAKAFTKEQLRQYKKTPGLKAGALTSTFEWFRQNFLFIVGGNLAYKCETVIESGSERIIWLEDDDQTNSRSICVNIRDEKGNTILSMDKNQWTSDTSLVEDIDSATRFEIRFSSITFQNFEDHLQRILIPKNYEYEDASKRLISGVKSDMEKEFSDEVPVCVVTGTFYLPQKVTLKPHQMEYGGVTMGCNYIGSSKTAFHLG